MEEQRIAKTHKLVVNNRKTSGRKTSQLFPRNAVHIFRKSSEAGKDRH